MELDDLKASWQKMDRRPDSEPGFDARILRELKRGRTRFGLRQMLWLPLFELGSSLLAALCVGTFLGNHFSELRFALPAVVLHIAAVLTIVASAWQAVRSGGSTMRRRRSRSSDSSRFSVPSGFARRRGSWF